MENSTREDHASDLQGSLSSVEDSSFPEANGAEEKANAAMEGLEFHKEMSGAEEENGSEAASPIISAERQEQNGVFIVQLEEIKPQKQLQDTLPRDIGFSEEAADITKPMQRNIITESASEELVLKLRASVLNAERKAESLSVELAEAQKNLEEEIRARDKKYSELDAKFIKLQKRAKQRIQEVQKEKEDVEAQLASASERASQASAQCTSLQHDLERVRAQAGDALRSLDAERQQLRSINSKQRETIEDLERKLETRDREHQEAMRVTSEKEQLVNELTDKMMEMEGKHGAAVIELMSKHQKLVADLEAQLAEAVQERSKSAETVASLQLELANKETQIAQLDAASSGEAIRLTAALDAARAELARMEQEHEKERETWDATLEALKLKLEEAERLYLQQEHSAAKGKSQLESELQGVRQALTLTQAELEASREQAVLLRKEFSAYKVRAHSLLQKKEAELTAAKDAEHLATQEAALKEAQRVANTAAAERDRAKKALQETAAEHESQLTARAVALMDAQQKIRELAANLEATKARLLVEEESWQGRVDEINKAWQEKYNILEGKDSSKTELEKNVMSLKESHRRTQGEYDTFREMANKMLESKDQEIARLLEEIRNLQRTIYDMPKVSRETPVKSERGAEENLLSAGEQQILILARQQAQREEELAQCQRHIQALQDEIVELEHENRLHTQQEAALKEELRNLERGKKREGVDMTYLKNVILKLLETGEVEALLPVIAMLLQFSREEVKKCQEVYNVVPEAPTAGAATDAPRTLLSRFLFTKAGK